MINCEYIILAPKTIGQDLSSITIILIII